MRLAILIISVTCWIHAIAVTGVCADDDLLCLAEDARAAAGLYGQLQRQAYRALDERDEQIEKLLTTEQIEAYQTRLRQLFLEQIGGLPERTPLDARTTRTIQADGYRIENVVFASQPRHHVTANLYLPDASKPVPGVVVASGHSRTGKTADYNQRFGIMLARHGIAALCFDPIGQGERSQILDTNGGPKFGSTTTEHFLVGVGSILVGRSTARYRIWDAMRAIDYLSERPEVDAERIGFTGCSGGGTMTSYLMALDDRVACAAPACYLTTWRRLIETIGPQDAEQNVFGQVKLGIDHPDYVLMRAPRPTLISCTTDDFFDVGGTWANYRQAKRIYGRLGFPERVDLVEMDGGHGVKPQNLATIAHWMQRWLLDIDQPVPIAELAVRLPEELLCTETGQVLTSLAGERTVFELNAEYETQLADRRQALWQTHSRDEMRSQIRERLGIARGQGARPPRLEKLDRVERGSYHVDKFVLHTQSSVPLPGLTLHPPEPADDAYLVLHDDGKIGGIDSASAQRLVADNQVVVTLDLSGQGETGRGERDPLLTDWKTYFLCYLLGDSLLGKRVEDALAAGDFVAFYERDRNEGRSVHLIGFGHSGIVALHAAALQPELFASVTLHDVPSDWASVVRQVVPSGQLDSAVHGALSVYDLPDLVQLAGPDKVVKR